MGLSSLQLDAFFAAARALNFSQAADDLHITQSALSQRIKALEEELASTLFTRLPRGVQLTEAGERLLRYCQARFSMEHELVEQLSGKTQGDVGLGGQLRIAGYSSVVRSVVLPALAPLIREHPNLQAHVQSAEVRQLPELLLTGNVDFIVTDTPLHRADLEAIEIGHEEYVMCESAKVDTADRYLDHDPGDTTTHRFFAHQTRPTLDYKRAFMDEIYAIIDGVAGGLGKAVVSRHLVERDKRIRILDKLRSMEVPVLLCFHKQPYYTALHKAAVAALTERCPGLLLSSD
jgi:DNA-binding transcriptional LysR family regulator